MKPSGQLAASTIPGLQRQGEGRRSYRVKASASYVDETLFGSRVGTQPMGPEFDPPWVRKDSPGRPLLWGPQTAGVSRRPEVGLSKARTLANTPRKSNRYRLKSYTPSYCDESLFGLKPEEPGCLAPWMKKEDTAKLCHLLWTPSPVPRSQSSLSSHPKESPMRAVHPQSPGSQALADFETEYKGNTDFWKRPGSDLDSSGWDSVCPGHPQSLTQLLSPDRHQSSVANSQTRRRKISWSPIASVTS